MSNEKAKLSITIGVDYKSAGSIDTITLGDHLKSNSARIFDSRGNSAEVPVFFTPLSIPIPDKPFYKETLSVGSGAFHITTRGTCSYATGPTHTIDSSPSGLGYIYLESLESESGNILHWGTEASGVTATINNITYNDFSVVGLLNPGEKSLFRLNPSSPSIKFVSASGLAALAEPTGTITKKARPTRFTYTIFPR